MSGSINEAEVIRPKRVASAFWRWMGPLVIATASLASLLPALDGLGESPTRRDAPGLTLDEIFNIQTGVYLWRSLIVEGPSLWTIDGAKRVFGADQYNPDHPPLGRVLIGGVHDLTARLPAGPDAPPLSLIAARRASALLFALTVLGIGWITGRWFGPGAACVASAALALMPRAAGHAHLAALETATNAFFALTLLWIADWGESPLWRTAPTAPTSDGPLTKVPAPAWRPVLVAGFFFGLTLLTKIQAILLPVPIGLWCVWRWGWSGAARGFVIGLVGGIVFLLGWPWLWLDPLGNTLTYFQSAAHRPTLYCYYLGTRYADIDVPWHYAWIMTASTIPVGTLLLAGIGLRRSTTAASRFANASNTASSSLPRRFDARVMLLTGTVVYVLAFFGLPGVRVYDGTRLFLVVCPLLAVLAGRGAAIVTEWSRAQNRRYLGTAAIGLMYLSSLAGMALMHPCLLSSYNGLVGGLRGADRLGFEPTYWRDSVTRRFLEDVATAVPRGSTLYVAPVLHPANRIDLPLLSPLLRRQGLRFDSYDNSDPTKQSMRYVLVFRRHADPWEALEPAPEGAKLLAEVARQGVQLAGLYDLRPEESSSAD